MPESRDQLDEALDDALATYLERPDHNGLERRILAYVSQQAEGTRRVKLSTLAYGAAAAIILVSLFWWQTAKAPIQTVAPVTTLRAAKQSNALRTEAESTPEPAAVAVNAVKRRTFRGRRRAEPKLSRFPTPSPLSEEERALVQLVTRYPNKVPQELINFGGPIKPVQITALEIKPLQ